MTKAKDAIATTLAALISIQNIKDITVSDVLRYAHINKSSFYYHFSSLEDALAYLVSSTIDAMTKGFSEAVQDETFGDDAFEKSNNASFLQFQYCYDNQELITALLWGDLRERFIFSYVERMKHIMRHDYETSFTLSSNYIDTTEYAEYMHDVASYIHISLIETWASRDFEESPETMMNIMGDIANMGTNSSIQVKKHAASPRMRNMRK